MTETIRIANLERSFERGDTTVHALRGLDLTIDQGEGHFACGFTHVIIVKGQRSLIYQATRQKNAGLPCEKEARQKLLKTTHHETVPLQE